MQTVASGSKWLRGLLIAALYVSVFGCATQPEAPSPAPAPKPSATVPVAKATAAVPTAPQLPLLAAASAPSAASAVAAAGSEAVQHHIALILPLNSPAFSKEADAVQQGFKAAASLQPNGLPVRVYPCKDEKLEVAAIYQQALKEGAVAVAGPLTRAGVMTLAAEQNLAVPTLALNVVDSARTDQLYFFGLPVETEARQIAQWATHVGLLGVTIVRTDSALSKRLTTAFAEQWKKSGGLVQGEIVYSGDIAPLRMLSTEPGNMVYLAAEVDKARLMRPYISNLLPVYATSQVFVGNANKLLNYDLSEVHFVDMPWVIQPDHPAVMVFPHATPALPPELERLYALGIDAYRMLQVIYQHDAANTLPLDGVTGKLRLNGHLVEREAAQAVLREGQGYAMDSKSLPFVIDPRVAIENKMNREKEEKENREKEGKGKK